MDTTLCHHANMPTCVLPGSLTSLGSRGFTGNEWLEQPFRTSPMTATAGSQALRNKVTKYAPMQVHVTPKTPSKKATRTEAREMYCQPRSWFVVLRKRSASRSSGKSWPAASGSPTRVKVRGPLVTHGVRQRFQGCLGPSMYLLFLQLVYQAGDKGFHGILTGTCGACMMVRVLERSRTFGKVRV